MGEARDWFRLARVRSGERPGAPVGGRLFSRDLQPHVLHPRVQALGPDVEHELLRRALARFLYGTCVLETAIVNEVAVAIAYGTTPFTFGDEARLDARKVYCDEGYHALLAAELLDRIGGSDGAKPAFQSRLDALRDESADREMVTLLFTIASETLLSANLSILAHDAEVEPAVRAFVDEHGKDEAWHSRFFAARAADVWAQLDARDRDRWGGHLPALIYAFTNPDLDAIRADLGAVGVAEPDGVVADTWSDAALEDWARRAARPTVVALQRAGALEGSTRDAFAGTGLLD